MMSRTRFAAALALLAAALSVSRAASTGDCPGLVAALAAAPAAGLDYNFPDPGVSGGNFLSRLAQEGHDTCIAPAMEALAEDSDREEVITFADSFGQLPSDVAAYFGQTASFEAIVAIAVELGAPASELIEHEDNKGRTPFILAAKGGHLEMTNYLVGEGADVNHVSL